jgi:hypothetical protein
MARALGRMGIFYFEKTPGMQRKNFPYRGIYKGALARDFSVWLPYSLSVE